MWFKKNGDKDKNANQAVQNYPRPVKTDVEKTADSIRAGLFDLMHRSQRYHDSLTPYTPAEKLGYVFEFKWERHYSKPDYMVFETNILIDAGAEQKKRLRLYITPDNQLLTNRPGAGVRVPRLKATAEEREKSKSITSRRSPLHLDREKGETLYATTVDDALADIEKGAEQQEQVSRWGGGSVYKKNMGPVLFTQEASFEYTPRKYRFGTPPENAFEWTRDILNEGLGPLSYTSYRDHYDEVPTAKGTLMVEARPYFYRGEILEYIVRHAEEDGSARNRRYYMIQLNNLKIGTDTGRKPYRIYISYDTNEVYTNRPGTCAPLSPDYMPGRNEKAQAEDHADTRAYFKGKRISQKEWQEQYDIYMAQLMADKDTLYLTTPFEVLSDVAKEVAMQGLISSNPRLLFKGEAELESGTRIFDTLMAGLKQGFAQGDEEKSWHRIWQSLLPTGLPCWRPCLAAS